ncbi:MAG: hypothetical protein PVS2B2_11020 [Candidatus Acidiferrum sp.]
MQVLPPPVGMYSNASLKGQYAFSMSGQVPTAFGGAPLSRIGSFIADGSGNISGAIEDVRNLAGGSILNPINFGTGTYNIRADGRGALILGTGSSTLSLSVVLTSTTQGLLIQVDGNATSSGSFVQETPTAFSATSFSGNYVFDVSGISVSSVGSTAPLAVMGRIGADGNNTLSSGMLDENDGNQAAPSGVIHSGVGGNYQMDAQFGSTYGRGLLTVTYNAYNAAITRTFVYYIVNGTRVKWLEEDNLAITIGDAVKQSGAIAADNTGFTGSFVYLVGGGSSSGPLERVARFTADGAGNLGKIALDDNANGAHGSLTNASTITNAHYVIDAANAGSGRGTFTFTDSHLGTYNAVFYLVSEAQAAIQDTSLGLVSDGTMLAQSSGPFTNAILAGNYAFNWSGVVRPSQTFSEFQEDFGGQYLLSGSGVVSGAVDYVELGFLGSNPINLDVPLAGTLAINGDGTASNNFQFLIRSSPTSTLNFAAYAVNANTTFLVATDSDRVTAGSAILQQ